MKTYRNLYPQIWDWDNLYGAYRKARKGKRSRAPTATFELNQEAELVALRQELKTKGYQPGSYTSFYIHEPKRRIISAAPFRDRIVHHALCNVIEPIFERTFIHDSYANRVGKGTHRALDRTQQFARRFPYVLQLDIRQFFPSIDHMVLRDSLARKIGCHDTLWLIDQIIASGAGLLTSSSETVSYPGDDLLTPSRSHGLPIGNLTSQFWANCHLNPLDQFIKRELKCTAYLRYVDDLLLFGDSKSQLWQWHKAITHFLNGLRLSLHSGAHPQPVAEGIPFLGFVIFPEYRRLKRRKVVYSRRRLHGKLSAYKRGELSRQEFRSAIHGWLNHVRYADSWGLREAILSKIVL